MQQPLHRRPNSAGFTLIEAMVVVAIAGILIGFTYAGFTGMLARYRCQGAVNRVAQILKLAQMKAIEQNVRYYIHIAAGNDTLTIKRTHGCDNNTQVTTPLEEVNLATEYPGVEVSGASCDGIYFNCRGLPRTAIGGNGICSIRLRSIKKPTEEGNVTIAWMGRIQVETPDQWKY